MTALDSSRTVTLPLGIIEKVTSTVLSLDPGGTTGYSYFTPCTGQVTCGQLGPGAHHCNLLDLIFLLLFRIGGTGQLVVVYEQFEFRQNHTRDRLVLDSKEYIGVIKLATQMHEGITLASHTASEGISFIGDNKLMALGWHHPTRAMPHARDALRHLLRYLVVTLKVQAPITTAWFSGKKGIVHTDVK